MCKFTVGTQKAAAGAAPRASANKMCACTEEHMCVHARTHTRARTHRRIYRWPIYARSDYGLIAGRHSRGSEFVSSTSGASDAATVAPVVLKTRGGGGGDDRLLMLIVLALLQDLASKWYQLDAGPVSAIPIPC